MLIITPLAVRTGFAFSFGNKTYSIINITISVYKQWEKMKYESTTTAETSRLFTFTCV